MLKRQANNAPPTAATATITDGIEKVRGARYTLRTGERLELFVRRLDTVMRSHTQRIRDARTW